MSTFYLRPHDGSFAIGVFATSDDAITFYHTNMDLSGCDVVEAIDQSTWPTPGNSLFFRFEFTEPEVQP